MKGRSVVKPNVFSSIRAGNGFLTKTFRNWGLLQRIIWEIGHLRLVEVTWVTSSFVLPDDNFVCLIFIFRSPIFICDFHFTRIMYVESGLGTPNSTSTCAYYCSELGGKRPLILTFSSFQYLHSIIPFGSSAVTLLLSKSTSPHISGTSGTSKHHSPVLIGCVIS